MAGSQLRRGGAGRPRAGPADHVRGARPLDRDGWELYEMASDPTESTNVAGEHPERLRELISLWWTRPPSTVLPVAVRCSAPERGAPQTSRPRTRLRLLPPEWLRCSLLRGASNPHRRQHRGRRGDSGRRRRAAWSPRVAMRAGSPSTCKAGACATCTTNLGRDRFALESTDTLSEGRHALRFEFEPTGEPDIANGRRAGRGQLYVDARSCKRRVPAYGSLPVRAGGTQLRL